MPHILFTTDTCPNCPRAKDIVHQKNIDAEIVNASEPDGLEIARNYNISHVPTLIELDDAREIVSSFDGIHEIEALTY